eukprot:CAMPEP_0173093508 /NCGR_PEP_ID=MMETSP1102-20130122/30133_1 /TAXON_ID=49646 /ORGANISM="Geminigera sp., Strain Caron Lab Isolate" /LENGTH=199 /DNA_ID=CAMNT_0013981739 /DNA_START=79 /DNA_END=675 /DNA_ORIENTATION=-
MSVGAGHSGDSSSWALREHDAESAGRIHWDFDDDRECGGMSLFALVRILKLIEVAYRLMSSCRAAFKGNPRAMICLDGLVVLMGALFSLVGAGAACQQERVYEWYADSYGRCNWNVLLCILWMTLLEVLFALGERGAMTSGHLATWNSFRRWTCCKRCDPCIAVYSWQLYLLNFILVVVSAAGRAMCNSGQVVCLCRCW